MFQNISEMFWIISIPQKDWESRMTFLARLFLKIYFTQYRIIVFIRSWDGKKKIHKSLCSIFIYILVSHFQKQGCKKTSVQSNLIFMGLNLIQVKRWCAVGSSLDRTSGPCVRRSEDWGHRQITKSHHFLRLRQIPLTLIIPRSKMIRPHTVPLKEHSNHTKRKQMKLLQNSCVVTRTSTNIQVVMTPQLAFQNRKRWKRRRSVAGTEFPMRLTTCWISCWIWTLPPGSQLLRLFNTRCSKTCETVLWEHQEPVKLWCPRLWFRCRKGTWAWERTFTPCNVLQFPPLPSALFKKRSYVNVYIK